jgi:hypothetical protein
MSFRVAKTVPSGNAISIAGDSASRIYQAYSGCDTIAHINDVQIGTLEGITISITREVVPQYTMNGRDPKGFVKGKRGIAGTLSFSTFDRHALIYDAFRSKFNGTGPGMRYGSTRLIELLDSTQQYATGDRYGDPVTVDAGRAISSLNYGGRADIQEFMRSRVVQYSDEIPPFNITLTMINDSGAASYLTVEGVVIVNEAYGVSIDDLTSSSAFTYVARKVTPLTSLTDFFYPIS